MLTKAEKKKRKDERRKRSILGHIQKDMTFRKIASKFNVSYQRVAQVAAENKISRQTNIQTSVKSLYEKVFADEKNGLTTEELLTKYKISKQYLNFLYYQYSPDGTLYQKVKEKRDNKIINDFINGKTAANIVDDTDKTLGDPTKIVSLRTIYSIVSKNGHRKYPKIGDRSKGISFEKKSVMNFIISKRKGKNKLTYKEIAKQLNDLGHKTVQGNLFTTANTQMKYLAYLKREVNNEHIN